MRFTHPIIIHRILRYRRDLLFKCAPFLYKWELLDEKTRVIWQRTD